MKRIFLITTVLICQVAYGQIHYTKVRFVKGMPGQIKAKLVKSKNAEINIGPYYKNLYIICRDTNSFNNTIFFSLINEDGSFSLTPAGLKQVKEDEFTTQLSLKTTSEDELSPLNIIIYPDKKILSYAWGDSVLGFSQEPKITKEYQLKPGKIFPSLSVESPNGAVNIAAYKEKIIVINWWSTSCIGCVEEMPELNRLVEKYKGKPVEFFAIIWDKENLEKFLKEHPFEYKQLYGNAATEKLLGGAFPRNIIISKDFKIIYDKLGVYKDTWKMMNKIINNNL
jgi:thiol-disulfide isomerase/thioredoxin